MSRKHPPFVNATGSIQRIFDKIQEAKTPTKFTVDFLAEVIGARGGSSRPFIPLLKRLGFLGGDGSPTARYRSFRNPDSAGSAMAAALREGYADLYQRNEYVHELDRDRLKNLVVESTGLEAESSTVRAIVGTFEALKSYADFEATNEGLGLEDELPLSADADSSSPSGGDSRETRTNPERHATKLGVTYQINVVMPSTDDPAVFAAIFRAMKEHLL